MKYTVAYDDGQQRFKLEFPCPSRLPQEGDVYAATIPFGTVGRIAYAIGDRFAVMGRTQQVPHCRVSSIGNLLVLCKGGTSVWTEFDAGVARGTLVLVAPNVSEDRLAEVREVLDSIRMRSAEEVTSE